MCYSVLNIIELASKHFPQFLLINVKYQKENMTLNHVGPCILAAAWIMGEMDCAGIAAGENVAE